MTENEDVPDCRHLTVDDLDKPEPNRDEDDDTIGPEDDDPSVLEGLEPPAEPDLTVGYPVAPGTDGGYAVDLADCDDGYMADQYVVASGDVDGYEVNG